MSSDKKLTARADDFSAWYNEVVQRAELVGYTPVKGCLVIRPYGYAIWERVQAALDGMFKATGHQNAYFPMFIPESFWRKEAEHVKGFAPETALVTHGGGKELEEPLVVRPTSEAIIWPIAADWIQSYRDLPLLLNQWVNVVRWELRTRPFLRTLEFLWQEGHTAHATQDEAEAEARQMLGIYRRLMEEWIAMPPVTGRKTEQEKFAGADRTYACEPMMQDNRALQAATSHNLGQNFAKAFDVKFQTEDGQHDYVWNTSWGASTRLMGGLVMTHGDDVGLIVPPRLAPYQAVIVPIYKSEDERTLVLEAAGRIASSIGSETRIKVDDRETLNPGAKFYEWERKGVPIRIEVGPKDVAKGQVMLVRRFVVEDGERKFPIAEGEVATRLPAMLEEMQAELLETAVRRREENTYRGVSDYDEFKSIVSGKEGFIYTGWCGSEACETKVKEDTRATIRVLPDPEFQSETQPETCILCGAPSSAEVVWARAY